MNKTYSFKMPNGEVIRAARVSDFEAHFPLNFEQYAGFQGIYDNAFLSKFTLLTDDSNSVESVLDEKDIDTLKNETVIALRFGKIPETEVSFKEVIDRLKDKYADHLFEGTTPNEDFIDNQINVKDPTGNIVCKIKYARVGIPGTIVEVIGY